MGCKSEKQKLINRINRIYGQVNGLKIKLNEENHELEDDLFEVIRQLASIKGAINSMMNSYLEHYVKEHLIDSIKNCDKIDADIKIDTLLETIKTFGK